MKRSARVSNFIEEDFFSWPARIEEGVARAYITSLGRELLEARSGDIMIPVYLGILLNFLLRRLLYTETSLSMQLKLMGWNSSFPNKLQAIQC
ncbi:MAG: hypothetical protein ACPL07_02945 [Candidatus Bathyarchaeia archaeon]